MGHHNSKLCAKQPDTIFALDTRVIRWARTQGWATMAKAVSPDKIAKERAIITSNFSPKVSLVLEFLGTYRKLVLEYMLQFYGAQINPGPYQSFLTSAKRASISDAIDSIALGSTRLTSDYDLTLAGPAVHRIMLCTVEQLRKQTKSTSSFLFDSNLYIAPDLMLCPMVKARLQQLGVKVLRSAANPNRATPVPPPTNSYVSAERASILDKIGKDDAHLSEDEIIQRYRDLAKLGEQLDTIVYKNSGAKSQVSTTSFFNLLLGMNRLGLEAYHGLSTILMVVNGMQAGQRDDVLALLGRGHKINAALENVVDLTNHWSFAVANLDQSMSSMRDTVAAKVAKYAARIVFCLDAAGVESALKEKLRDTSQLRSILESIGNSAIDMARQLGMQLN